VYSSEEGMGRIVGRRIQEENKIESNISTSLFDFILSVKETG
jgi:hypothetical protein